MSQGVYQIDEKTVKAYQEDGVVCLRGVVPKDLTERMRDASYAYMERKEERTKDIDNSAEGGGRFFTALFMGEKDEAFKDFRTHSQLPQVASALMGADKVRFYYEQLFIKFAGPSARTPWHQDLPFWPLRGNDIISLWVALTPSNVNTSALEYVAGSHRWNKFYRPETVDKNANFGDPELEPVPDFTDPEIRAKQRMLSWDMEPGDVLCHHPLAIHGADENKGGGHTRVGLSLRYMGNDVTWDPRSNVMKIPRDPDVPAGAYPADDAAFPVVLDKSEVSA